MPNELARDCQGRVSLEDLADAVERLTYKVATLVVQVGYLRDAESARQARATPADAATVPASDVDAAPAV